MGALTTSRLARVACMAIWPQSRPMSLTIPTHWCVLSASTCAALMALCASSTAVSNPNDLSMIGMSLSIVFGMPDTATGKPRFLHSS